MIHDYTSEKCAENSVGTGASNVEDARANLGLGTLSTQAANNVTITGEKPLQQTTMSETAPEGVIKPQDNATIKYLSNVYILNEEQVRLVAYLLKFKISHNFGKCSFIEYNSKNFPFWRNTTVSIPYFSLDFFSISIYNCINVVFPFILDIKKRRNKL